MSTAYDQYVWASEAGYTRLSPDEQVAAGLRLIELIDHSIALCGMPTSHRRRQSLRLFAKKLDALRDKVEGLQGSQRQPAPAEPAIQP